MASLNVAAQSLLSIGETPRTCLYYLLRNKRTRSSILSILLYTITARGAKVFPEERSEKALSRLDGRGQHSPAYWRLTRREEEETQEIEAEQDAHESKADEQGIALRTERS